MQAFDAANLSSALVFLASIGQRLHDSRAGKFALSKKDRKRIICSSEALRRFGTNLEFSGVREAAKELIKRVNHITDKRSVALKGGEIHNLHAALDHLIRSTVDALKEKRIFALSLKEQSLFEPIDPLFGSDVAKAFPGHPAEDIEEAGKCVALERSTAAVFHLMRTLEAATTVIAEKIGATILDKNGVGLGWGVVANNMKPVIEKMKKGSPEQIQWYRVQSKLDVVNRAYRVPTAHPKEAYTLAQACEVFDATRSFMIELSQLL